MSIAVQRNAKDDLTTRLLSTFKQLISEGTLLPGARLPPEREIAANFGVSRASLRQALKILEIMGIISQRVGDGTYLNAGAPGILAEPMEFLVLLDGISFHELMEARIIVEPELAARAASRATQEDMSKLRTCLAEMEKSRGNHSRLIEQDLRFHQIIFEAAGNRVCTMMFSVVHRQLTDLIEHTSQLVELEHTLRLHKGIYLSIRKHDAEEARQRMLDHLTDARSLLIRASESQAQARLGDRMSALSMSPRNGRRSSGK
jgi:GntR family transcriptional repressor for pyruvate dehydrogenase complex